MVVGTVQSLARMAVDFPDDDLPLVAVLYAIRESATDPLLEVCADQAMRWAAGHAKPGNDDDLWRDINNVVTGTNLDCIALDCECHCHLGRNPALKDCEQCDQLVQLASETAALIWQQDWRVNRYTDLIILADSESRRKPGV